MGYTVSYPLDARGLVTKADYPTGIDTVFTYNDDGDLATMVDSTGTTSWTRDLEGRATQLAQPQGTLDYTFDSAGRTATMLEAAQLERSR